MKKKLIILYNILFTLTCTNYKDQEARSYLNEENYELYITSKDYKEYIDSIDLTKYNNKNPTVFFMKKIKKITEEKNIIEEKFKLNNKSVLNLNKNIKELNLKIENLLNLLEEKTTILETLKNEKNILTLEL